MANPNAGLYGMIPWLARARARSLSLSSLSLLLSLPLQDYTE